MELLCTNMSTQIQWEKKGYGLNKMHIIIPPKGPTFQLGVQTLIVLSINSLSDYKALIVLGEKSAVFSDSIRMNL